MFWSKEKLSKDIVMNQDYTDIIQDLSQQLSSAIQEREIDLSDSVSQK